jgi:hypothetical protein
MKYSELKKRIKLLRERGYYKFVGYPLYMKDFSYKCFRLKKHLGRFDLYVKMDFNEFLNHIEEVAMADLKMAYETRMGSRKWKEQFCKESSEYFETHTHIKWDELPDKQLDEYTEFFDYLWDK